MKAKIYLALFLFFSIVFISPAYADTNFIDRQDVQSFIQTMVKKHHFNQQALITLFSEVKIRPQVINHLNKPLEKETWSTYQRLFITEWRIRHGAEFWDQYANVLQQAEKIYGVPADIIVATIGIESKYGQEMGAYRVMDSLTNLAFSNSSRAAFFRHELEEFLLLSREERLDPLKVMGSYAGAIGQAQFMPSSYRVYAVNFSKSGQTDLMHNVTDIIGSIANYYKKHGWSTNMPVAMPALIIGDRYHYLMRNANVHQPLTIAELDRYGVTPRYPIADDDLRVKIIALPNHYSTEYWLGFHNFDVIKRYNSSNLYAMAVYQLGGYISQLRKQLHNG